MERKNSRNDIIIFSLLLIACAALYFRITPEQIAVNANLAGDSGFTPTTFPNLLTAGIAAASALGLIGAAIRYRRAGKSERQEKKEAVNRQQAAALLMPYLTFAVIAAYVLLFAKLGFVLSTALVIPLLMLLFGCRKWYFYLVVYGFTAVMYVLFKFVLYVPLP